MRSTMNEPIRSPRMAGHVIRKTRKDKGWSQTDLADRMNVRQGTVSKLETGKSVRIETLFDAIAVLGLDLTAQSRKPKPDYTEIF